MHSLVTRLCIPFVAVASLSSIACGGSGASTSSSSDGSGFAGGSQDEFGGSGGGLIGAGGSSSGTGGGGAAPPFTGGGGSAGSGTGGAVGAGGGGNTNVSLGGSQDFGYFRALLDNNQVPMIGDFDAGGFFAEHHTALPDPVCGERICLQPMLGVMGNLLEGSNCTMLQLGLNSPIVADPNARPPLTLSVVVDVSGSMTDKIAFVRQGLSQLVDGLRDEDRFALVTYSSDTNMPFPMADVALRRTEIKNAIDALEPGGSTNLFQGLETGYQVSGQAYDSGRQNRVILLSDGMPTVGITGEGPIVDMSRGYNSDGIGLTTIGLGTSFNVNLMRNLALQADGNFYFVEDSGAVSEVFTEELSYFTVPIAFDLEVDVRRGNLYDFGRAVGTPFWTDSTDGGSLEVPSVFLAHRESADDVTPENGRRGGGSALLIELMPQSDDGSGATEADVATVDLRFREPGTNRIVTDSVTVNYPLPPWTTRPEGFFSAPDLGVVHKSFVMLNIYVGIERAVTDFHGGTRAVQTDAIAALERLIAAVTDYNEEIADKDIELDLDLLAQLRDVMVANGTPPPTDPAIPTDPWPAD